MPPKARRARQTPANGGGVQGATEAAQGDAAGTRAASGDGGGDEAAGGSATPRASTRAEVEGLLEGLCFCPEAFVFDLDDTLWRGDVDLTAGPPFPVDGRAVVAKDGQGLELFPDVPQIFDWLDAGGRRAAVASSTGRGEWADRLLQLLQTGGGVPFAQVAAVREMHRAESVANRSKAIHLKRIAERLGCQPHDLLFFDNMAHNIEDGESIGVTSCYTPAGLTWASVASGLVEFDRRALARAAAGE
mmetsp:Transcript_4914/g.13730  ORF Transcript_4914/g.13730 Transcript_4914/m.13730 type:complete len:246 (+) Transcript_4914:122-859(+)